MVAIQAVVELFGMVPAFVWIGLILVIVLLGVLVVITTKRRNREVAELDKLFAESDKSFDQPLALKRRPRKKSEKNKDQKVNEEKGETGETRPGEDAVQAGEEPDGTEKGESGEEMNNARPFGLG